MRVLVVTHEASRTGAPRIAALVARSLVSQGHVVHVLSRAPGPLLPDFAAVAQTSIEFLHRVRRKLWSIRLARSVAYIVDTALATMTLLRRRPDLVYVNSTSAAIYLRPARWLGLRTLLHVHESGILAERFLKPARAPRRLAGIALIACSPSVQTELAGLTGRSAATIALLPSVPDDAEVVRRATEPPDHHYEPGDLVVGCCGTVEHRKGADLWVSVAKEVRRALPGRRVRFVWTGEIAQPLELAQDDDVEFTGPTPNPYAHMRRFDVATLPSRDDPFPLVVLEAMLLGTPVVAFDVGGVSSQIGDAGVVVPPEDVSAFARAVVELLNDEQQRVRLGGAAKTRVATLYSARAFASGLADVVAAATRLAEEEPTSGRRSS